MINEVLTLIRMTSTVSIESVYKDTVILLLF